MMGRAPPTGTANGRETDEMVGLGIAALAAVMIAMNWRLLGGQVTEDNVATALFCLPGLVLLGAWLFRLVQWGRALRATPELVDVLPCLTTPTIPARGGLYGPVGQSLWMVVGTGKHRRYQQVSWQPWLSGLRGTVKAELRAASSVGVLDIAGHGRLWPTSRMLNRPPKFVKLAEFATAESPRTRGDAIWTISILLACFIFPCAFIGSLWGIAYLAAFAFALWLWLGLVPPGWLPTGGQADKRK